jgi:hypothetical protein
MIFSLANGIASRKVCIEGLAEALIANSAALVAPPDSAVSGG